MRFLTGQWDSVQFIGLSVYLLMHSLTGQWDSVRFIGLFDLSVYFSTVYFSMGSLNKPNKPVYFSMHSLTRQWDSVRFIGLFGLSVYFSTVYFSMGSLNKPCLLYTSPSPRDRTRSRMPSSA